MLVSILWIAAVGYLVLQPLVIFRSSGWMRWIAVAPLLVMLPVALHAAWAYSHGSNIWPLLLLFVSPLAFVYVLTVAFVQGAGGVASSGRS